jgi:hypothetical protein
MEFMRSSQKLHILASGCKRGIVWLHSASGQHVATYNRIQLQINQLNSSFTYSYQSDVIECSRIAGPNIVRFHSKVAMVGLAGSAE